MPTYFSSTDFVNSLAGAIRDAFTRPTEFFRQLPKATSYKESAILLVLVMALPMMLIFLLRGGDELLPHLATVPLLVILFVILCLTIPFTLLSAWLWAWYISWAVRRFAGGSLSVMDAFQLYAYSSIPSLFGWIPVIGGIMFFWSIYLEWKGLTAFAGVGNGKALLIIFMPVIILIVSLLMLGILIGIYLSQSPQTGTGQMF